MRKHFLILFLMALLPLAGWSANFNTEGKAVVDDIPYGQNVTIDNVHFTLNGVDQTPVGSATPIYALEDPFKYYTNADATTPLEGKPQCGTTYYIRIVPSDATNNGVTIAKVLFVKADLTVTVKNEGFFTKNFKDAKTALGSTLTAKKEGATTPATADIVISGIVEGEEIADVLTWSNVDYSYESENANCKSNGDWFTGANSAPIKTNKITFTGFTLTEAGKKNYNLMFIDTYMKIKQIPLTLSDYAASLANGKFTVTRDAKYSATNKPKYTGVAQNLKYTVKWQYATGKVYEMTDDDIVIKYKGTSGDPVVDAIDADTYTPVVSFKANGNFSGEDIVITSTDAVNYEIVRRDLVVMLNYNYKTYDGSAFLSSLSSATPTPVYNFSTLMGKDAGKEVTGITLEANSTASGYLKKDVGFYSMIANITSAQIKYPAVNYTQAEADAYNTEHNLSEGDDGYKTTASVKTPVTYVDLSKNYSPVPFPANWEIKVKKITVTAEPTYEVGKNSITYGQDIPTITIKFKSGAEALEAEKENVLACYKATTADKEDLISGNNVITVALKEAADYISGSVTTEEAAAEAKETAEAVLANYEIELKNGNLKVDGVGFTIAPNVAPTYEYGATITPNFVAVNTSVTPNVIVTTAKNPTFLYRKATEDASAATEKIPTEIGNYIVSIAEDEALAPTIGYDGKKIVYNETPFTITKKKLDFTIGDVTLHNGDTDETLNQYAKITLKNGYKLVGEETLKVEYSFKAGVSPVEGSGMNLLYAENTGLSGTEGKSYMAIQASLPEGVADNDNYELKADILGKLIIAEGRKLFVDGADANVNLLIKDAAAACANTTAVKYDVTFASRTLKANEWNVLVLPFAITPLDFCNAKCTVTLADNTTTKDYVNDYAVFNVLKSADMTKNSMKFGLTLNEIPANTPFLVKPTKDIEFMRTVGTGASQKKYYLTFTGRKVEYKEVPAVTEDGVNFIGTYKNQTVEGGAKIMYMGADDAGHYTFFTATDNGEAFDINLGSTRAYLDFTGTTLGDAAAPTILVEEANGSTTAIRGITADGVAVAAEGWYTINGIKLQGVPTEKGVYINNGKKVVVK